jgi:hypothetical protein
LPELLPFCQKEFSRSFTLLRQRLFLQQQQHYLSALLRRFFRSNGRFVRELWMDLGLLDKKIRMKNTKYRMENIPSKSFDDLIMWKKVHQFVLAV